MRGFLLWMDFGNLLLETLLFRLRCSVGRCIQPAKWLGTRVRLFRTLRGMGCRRCWRAASGRGLREGGLHRFKLSVFAGDQPGGRHFCSLHLPDASNKRVLIVSRLAVVLLGCRLFHQAIYAQSILEKMLWAYTIYSAALTPVVLAAFYSKRVPPGARWWPRVLGRRAQLLLGICRAAGRGAFGGFWLTADAHFPALFVAVVLLLAVSLFTRKPDQKQLEQFSELASLFKMQLRVTRLDVAG